MRPQFSKKVLITSLLSTLTFTSQSVLANQLEQVVVSANKTEQSINEVTSNVTIITAEELETKHYASLADALKKIAGISFTRNGGIGATTSIFVRGSKSSRTLVLVDGIRLQDPSVISGADFANINLANIERIEIIKGAQSGVWGSDAAAGVINIITKSNASEINLEYGTYSTRKATIAGNTQIGNTQLSINANRTLSDGFSAQAPAYEDIDQFEDDAYQNTNIIIKSKTEFNSEQTLGLVLNHTNSYSEYDGYNAPNSQKRSKTETDLVGVDYSFKNTKISVQHSDFKSNQLDEGYTDEVKGQTQSLEVQHKIDSWLLGALHTKNETDSEKPNFFYDPNNNWAKTYQNQNIQNTSNHSNAVFVTHQTKFKNLITNEALRWDDYSNFGSKVTGKFGIKYFLNDHSSVSANYGTAYNAPSLIQVINPWGTSNPDLAPENTREWNLSYQFHGLVITYFDKRVKDLIDWRNNQYQNVGGKTKIQGTEVEYSISLANFGISANYTHLNTEDSNGDPLAHRPEDQIGIDIDWYASDKLDLNLSGLWIGKRPDSPYDAESKTQYYNVWDVVMNYQFNKQFSGYIKVDNLFDEYYQVVGGYATAERSIYAGVKAKF